jgi:hypothetical protein
MKKGHDCFVFIFLQILRLIISQQEIQALLVQMSHETADESSPHFIPQLYRQLQHKVLQLSTVLNRKLLFYPDFCVHELKIVDLLFTSGS